MNKPRPLERYPRETAHWLIDRRIPVAMLVAVAAQTIGAIWWAATTTARLDHVEELQKASTGQSERIVRLEEKIGTVQSGITELKTTLQGLVTSVESARPRR